MVIVHCSFIKNVTTLLHHLHFLSNYSGTVYTVCRIRKNISPSKSDGFLVLQVVSISLCCCNYVVTWFWFYSLKIGLVYIFLKLFGNRRNFLQLLVPEQVMFSLAYLQIINTYESF